MPELPEVETIKRILEDTIVGETIKDIRVFRSKSILTGSDEFVSSLKGETFNSVSRMGKFLIFHLTNDKAIISHLRMEGKYFACNGLDKPEKHDIMIYDFVSGKGLRFNDTRKFGIVLLANEKTMYQEPPLSELGKEPFVLSPEELYEGLKKKKSVTIKEALLDQTLIAGLGNIYDDEVLFASKVNPKRKASSISLDECRILIKESIRILNEAILSGGSTIKSYHPKEGVSGQMQNNLLAYGHGGENCPRCGFPLHKISIGGRGTVYCPKCQKNIGKPLIVGVTGPIASGKSSVSSYLEEKGYFHIDADKMIASLYSKNAIKEKIIAAFSEKAYEGDTLCRDYIRNRVVEDPSMKKELENILYPELYKEIQHEIDFGGHPLLCLDIPLLFLSPLEEECDYIIAVDANEKVQRERLKERGKNVDESLKLNHDYPRVKAKRKASVILDGNGSLESLKSQIEKLNFLFSY